MKSSKGDYKTKKLGWVFLALLFVRPTLDIWRDVRLFTLAAHPVNLTALLALCLALVSSILILPHYKKLFAQPIIIAWTIFCALSIVSYFYSFDKTSTVLETLKLLDLALAFGAGLVLAKNNSEFTKTLTWTLIVSTILPTSIAVYQWATETGLTIDQTPNRVYGTFAHPNILALFCLVALAGITYSYETKKTQRHSFLPFSIPILLFIIFATYTRIAWLALLAWLAAHIFITYRKIFWQLFLAGVVALVVIAGTYLILPKDYKEVVNATPIIQRLTYRPANADSIEWRWWVARDSFKVFTMRPLFGFGYGTFPTVWNTYKDPARRGDPSNEAHNDYVRIAIEEGAVGLLAYLAIFVFLIKTAWQKYKTSDTKSSIFLLSVLLYCSIALSENLLHHTAPAWWLWALWGAWSVE